TLTHTDLGAAGGWHRELEVQGAQDAIVGVTGQAVSLLRPPFSSGNEAVSNATWSAMQGLADHGYLTVLSSLDSQDWRLPGTAEIEANLDSSGSQGQVILMHDGGGDRAQTVAALDSALSRFADQGYKVTTVGDAVGIDSMRPASDIEQASGWDLLWGIRLSDAVVTAISWGIVAAGVVTLIRAVLFIYFAARHRRAASRLPGRGRGRG
ncbi:hypothetical protein, partial [Escherichia coli]|uniref:hypothetical protein n=1 Tax=Escherichia coli TaxID=562 RepID=UPI0032E814A6